MVGQLAALLVLLIEHANAAGVFGRKEGQSSSLTDSVEVDAVCDTVRTDPVAEWCCRACDAKPKYHHWVIMGGNDAVNSRQMGSVPL